MLKWILITLFVIMLFVYIDASSTTKTTTQCAVNQKQKTFDLNRNKFISSYYSITPTK
jgi:hypothetical protein